LSPVRFRARARPSAYPGHPSPGFPGTAEPAASCCASAGSGESGENGGARVQRLGTLLRFDRLKPRISANVAPVNETSTRRFYRLSFLPWDDTQIASKFPGSRDKTKPISDPISTLRSVLFLKGFNDDPDIIGPITIGNQDRRATDFPDSADSGSCRSRPFPRSV
jgi:hypothetical protein